MSQKVSFTAGADILRGQIVGAQSDGSVVTAASGEPISLVAFSDVASGTVGSFYTPGSEQVYALASGSISKGAYVIPSTDAGFGLGYVGAPSGFPPSGTFIAGVALTDAVSEGPVWISFSPSIV